MPLYDSKIWHNSCHEQRVTMTITNDGVFFSLVSFLFPFPYFTFWYWKDTMAMIDGENDLERRHEIQHLWKRGQCFFGKQTRHHE